LQYAIARQLEEAGFPQAGKGTWIGDPETLVWRSRVYVPTLEELIAACGARFGKLQRSQTLPEEAWTATCSFGRGIGYGNRATEAVARLWLVLKGESDFAEWA
jgi:hypothetical protein